MDSILPWDSPADVRRISPVEASAAFLRHLRDAWNHEMAASDPEARCEAQEIYLTVPASFDAVARELTVKPPARRVSATCSARGTAGRFLRLGGARHENWREAS